MIDWFASKIGLIIFVFIVAGVLLAFVFIQTDILSQSILVQQTNDIARMSDGLCNSCTFDYDFGKIRNVTLSNGKLIVDEIERNLITNTEDITVIAQKVVIRNEENTIKIS